MKSSAMRSISWPVTRDIPKQSATKGGDGVSTAPAGAASTSCLRSSVCLWLKTLKPRKSVEFDLQYRSDRVHGRVT